jgi:hypothetical protein
MTTIFVYVELSTIDNAESIQVLVATCAVYVANDGFNDAVTAQSK